MGKSKGRKKNLDTQNTQYEDEHVGEVESRDDSNKKNKEQTKKEKLTVKIEIVAANPDKIPPIIGYFPSGYDPLNHSGNAVKVYKNLKRNNRYQVVVRPNESRVEFVGTNYSGEATVPQMCTYALGVLDKSTQTLKVVPIAANKIFRLEPRFDGVDQPEDEPQDLEKTELTEEQKVEDKSKLDTYLTKKTIRARKKHELIRQTGDEETQQDINRTIEGIKIDEEDPQDVVITANSRNIPPHDLDATIPDMAYPLDKIIFKGEWDHLLDSFKLSQVGSEVAADFYPSFVRNRVYKLDDVKEEVEKRRLAGILSYITHLIKFKDKHSMDGISSAKNHKFPPIISQKFKRMFGDSVPRVLPSDKRDLLISYVLVLTLFVDDFKSDPSDIASDLRMSDLKLRPYYELLGCKLIREKQVLLATLPVPLRFPTVRRKRRRT